MMRGFHGEGDIFDFILGEKLHKSEEEVGRMSSGEVERWRAYFSIKGILMPLWNKRG